MANQATPQEQRRTFVHGRENGLPGSEEQVNFGREIMEFVEGRIDHYESNGIPLTNNLIYWDTISEDVTSGLARPTPEFVDSGSFETSYQAVYKQAVILFCGQLDGMCHILLLIMIDSVRIRGLGQTLKVLYNLSISHGEYPKVQEVSETLLFEEVEANSGAGVFETVSKLTHDCHRFKIDFPSGDFEPVHLEPGLWDPCHHNDIYCNHGWKGKYVMALGLSDRRIGGMGDTINIDGFFDGNSLEDSGETVDEDYSTSFSTTAPQTINSGFRVSGLVSAKDSDQEREVMRDLFLRMDDLAEEMVKIHEGSERKRNETLLSEVPCEAPAPASRSHETAVNDGILPEDSSSQIHRYKKKFMRQGTVMTPRTVISVTNKQGGRLREESCVETRLEGIPETIVGFVKTDRMVRREAESTRRAQPINGLAKPYRSNRLNLLSHLYTAFETLSKEQKFETVVKMVFSVLKRLNRSPTMELLCQVVSITFDKHEMVVCSNPYNLPYIEVGMCLSDDCVTKCFSLLEKEFEILWYQEMKALSLPSFSGRFSKLSEEKLQKLSVTRPPGKQEGLGKVRSGRRRSHSQSVLGF